MRTLNLWLTILSESLLYTLVLSRGSSTFGPYRIKEEIPPPLGWAKHSLPPSDHIITLRVGLPQQNFHVLVGHLDEISNPDHERYGKHLSKIQVEELVSPHPDSLEAVNAWLTTFGFRKEELDRSPASDWIILTIPINKAEELLNTVNFFSVKSPRGSYIATRLIISGSQHTAKTTSSVPPVTAYQSTFIDMLMLSNRLLCLDGRRGKSRRSPGLSSKVLDIPQSSRTTRN